MPRAVAVVFVPVVIGLAFVNQSWAIDAAVVVSGVGVAGMIGSIFRVRLDIDSQSVHVRNVWRTVHVARSDIKQLELARPWTMPEPMVALATDNGATTVLAVPITGARRVAESIDPDLWADLIARLPGVAALQRDP